jgi:hypothetical protein
VELRTDEMIRQCDDQAMRICVAFSFFVDPFQAM